MSTRGRRRVAAAACLLALAGCTSQPAMSGVGGGGDQGYVAGDGTITRLEPGERKPAPALEGPTLDGGSYRLADFRGDVVVVNTWASWCAPCRDETPGLQRAWEELRDEDVQFVGINTKDPDAAAARAFTRSFGVTYPSLVDEEGTLVLGFRATLPPNAVPSTLVIDRRGRVAARVLGKVSEGTLRSLVRDALAESKA